MAVIESAWWALGMGGSDGSPPVLLAADVAVNGPLCQFSDRARKFSTQDDALSALAYLKRDQSLGIDVDRFRVVRVLSRTEFIG